MERSNERANEPVGIVQQDWTTQLNMHERHDVLLFHSRLRNQASIFIGLLQILQATPRAFLCTDIRRKADPRFCASSNISDQQWESHMTMLDSLVLA
jgi:hypothetical protein